MSKASLWANACDRSNSQGPLTQGFPPAEREILSVTGAAVAGDKRGRPATVQNRRVEIRLAAPRIQGPYPRIT